MQLIIGKKCLVVVPEPISRRLVAAQGRRAASRGPPVRPGKTAALSVPCPGGFEAMSSGTSVSAVVGQEELLPAGSPIISSPAGAVRRYCCRRVVLRPRMPCRSIKRCQDRNSSTERR